MNESSHAVRADTSAMLPATEEAYAALEKRLVRKLDCRLMPVLTCMIVLNYLDRNALPNARVQGIESHLGLTGDEFNTCISILFAGYLALQIPSNLILTRVRPSIYLPVCMALWGVVSACTAAATNFQQLVVCRFFLGFLEAPFFPGALLLLSSWYTPKEMATRTAVMYTGSLLSSAFGGLVGAGIQYGLDGAHGLHSWQWLFIIEGTVTVVVSLGSVLVLPDFPSNTAWLTAEERAMAIHRLHAHSGTVDEERGPLLQGLRMAVLDYKLWLLTLIVVLKTSAGAVTQFIPTLVATFHFGKVQTLLLTAPPFVFAAIVALAVSVSSDKRGERCLHLIIPLTFALIGFIIAATTQGLVPRYFSLFLALGGVYGCYDITYAWMSSTIPRPLEKRSSAFAIANMVGNIAQVYSPYMYPKSSGPRYLPAMIANSGAVILSIACCATLYYSLRRENKILEAAQMHRNDDGDGDSDTNKNRPQEPELPVPALDSSFRYIL
ncbi:Major facilitator superfamily transporter [Cordyceps militaris]|uniref:Major facilitator superfamily transporter n=1 Tax=Cordyceps militaris TaxID=73501 RepID=A0A2H4S7N4_CORMI|nr:Major facilitator superfamily transporter [Cordyceps militaris]